MTERLMQHQRHALAFMLSREQGTSVPAGGILADDQVRSRTWEMVQSAFYRLQHTSLHGGACHAIPGADLGTIYAQQVMDLQV